MTDEELKKIFDCDRERRERRRPCCKNCAWFGDDTCFRYPPVRAKGAWARPAVGENEICGEFMHRTTGDTFQGRDHRLSSLRALVGELEDKIDRMKERES